MGSPALPQGRRIRADRNVCALGAASLLAGAAVMPPRVRLLTGKGLLAGKGLLLKMALPRKTEPQTTPLRARASLRGRANAAAGHRAAVVRREQMVLQGNLPRGRARVRLTKAKTRQLGF